MKCSRADFEFEFAAATKKSKRLLGFPSAQLVIVGSFAEPKWVKSRKTRGFLALTGSQFPHSHPHADVFIDEFRLFD
jgi:hypothetical protein